MPKVIALLCADIHLSLQTPVARTDDWMDLMKRSLNKLSELANHYNVPVLCAGDIFDHWKAPPELVNFALQYLPDMIAIPGQHDLPLHNILDLHKSAFQTLVEAGKVSMADPDGVQVDGMTVYGFPWGAAIAPRTRSKSIQVALAHQYVWKPGHSYPGALDVAKVGRPTLSRAIKGYDIVVFGDNHSGFCARSGKTFVFNCGSLMRRRSDEADYKPKVGLLMSNKTVKTLRLNVDRATMTEAILKQDIGSLDLGSLLDDLESLQSRDHFDYTEAMKQAMDRGEVRPEVRQVILEAMENA